MSRMDRIRREFGEEIAEVADGVVDGIPMSSTQLRQAFSDEELKELARMMEAVRVAQSEDAKVDRLLHHGRTALKLLSKLGVVL